MAGAYAAVATLWIVGSDCLVAWGTGAPLRNWILDTGKGLLFVAATTLLLHAVVRRLVARFEAAERELRLSDERSKFALDGAGTGVWDWDRETRRIYYSPQCKTMLGYAETEGDDHNAWTSRLHPEDRAELRRLLRQYLTGKNETLQCEIRLLAKDGTYHWVLSRGRVVRRSADGRPSRVIGTHSDISDRKHSEARINDALMFNWAILDAAPVGIMSFRAEGSVVSVNEAAARFFGRGVDELARQNFRQSELWQKFGLVAAADRAQRGQTVVLHSTKLVTNDGRTTWCDLRFAAFSHGGEQRLLLIVSDTTREQATSAQLKLLHAALEAAPTGWFVTDAHSVIEWVNPAFTRITGYAPAEAIGKKPSLLRSGRHSASLYANLWRTIRDGQIWQGELCNRRKDGSLFFAKLTIAPVRDAEGTITHFVAMSEDVTGQHELEQQLARSQRLESIGLLASGIAHDLNNMLAPIMLSVSLIKTRHADRETGELLEIMQSAAQRGAGVVQQVLTFARGVEGERVHLDVRPLVKELVQLARETFPREIRVVCEVPATPLQIEGDVTQLHQVLLNLAVNARDAMPEGGVLTLRATEVELDETALRREPHARAGKFINLRVADTGTGIPAEVLEHIFEPFFTTKPRGKGSGLGLSTVYGIVRSHGGYVEVTSTMGKGACFDVMIPVSVKARTKGSGAPFAASGAAPTEGAGRRILVVDDEAGIRLVTRRVLESAGFVVVLAEDGDTGLAKLHAAHEEFSAAIIDLMMPGMNGYKLAAAIRAHRVDLPMIVASGMMGDGDAGAERAALAELGVRVVLRKPFTETELLSALNAELGAAPKRAQGNQ